MGSGPGKGPSKGAEQQREAVPSGIDALRLKMQKTVDEAVNTLTGNPDILKQNNKLITRKQLQEGYQPLRDSRGQLVLFKSLKDLKKPDHPARKYVNNVLNGEYVIYKSEKGRGFIICKPKTAERTNTEPEEEEMVQS